MSSPILVLVLLTGQLAASEPLSLPAFRAELDRAVAAVDAAASIDQARAFAGTLPDQWRIDVDQRTITVDARWIETEIDAADASTWPARRERIRRRLVTLRAEVEDGVASNRDAAAILTNVLARPEFRRSPASLWLEQQRNRVARWVERMLQRLTGVPVSARAIVVMLAWVASIVALSALAMWLVTMITRRSRATALELGGSMPPRTPAREWARLAAAALQSGDPREAVRCGYHAVLCRLEEQGVWSVDDSRTPREYVHLLGGADPRRDPVADLTRQFEHIWYGRKPVTPEDTTRLSANLERLGCLHAD